MCPNRSEESLSQAASRHSGGQQVPSLSWLTDPKTFLTMLPTGVEPQGGSLPNGSAPVRLQEQDVAGLLRLLVQAARSQQRPGDPARTAELGDQFQRQLGDFPTGLISATEQVLQQLSQHLQADFPLPVQLAERLVLRLARESYQQGALSPAEVRELLRRLGVEVENLRGALGVPVPDSYGELLEQEFWSSLPKSERPPARHADRAAVGEPRSTARLRELVQEALQSPEVPREVVQRLQQRPAPAAQLLAEAFSAQTKREGRERVVELARAMGPAAAEYLQDRLRRDPPAASVPTLGLFSRLDPDALAPLLLERVAGWGRSYQDWAVRLLAAAGGPERGSLLLQMLDKLDPLVVPGALDAIGMSGNRENSPYLMRVAAGELPKFAQPYLRLKAVEALGRLRERSAAPLLRRMVESKAVWRWAEVREIRVAAAQSLLKIDPEWAGKFLAPCGLSKAELALAPLDPAPQTPWVRHRRYQRVVLPRQMNLVATTLRGQWSLTTQVLSLGGGVAECRQPPPPPGTEIELELQPRVVPVRATALVRSGRSNQVGFEIVKIDLEERRKLRRLLASLQPAPPPKP